MNIKFLIIFFSYFLILFSIIGHGALFSNIVLKKKDNLNYGYYGLFGIFLLIFYSYLSHFFFPHTLIHNLILMFFGLIYYLLFVKKKLSEIFFTSVIFLILFVSIIIFKTHDDFPYYHFGYSYYLTESNLIIGVGQFNHGFRTPSSIFYLNSLFYLPFIKFYFFHLPAVLILGFVNIVLIKNLIKSFLKNEINFINYFILLSILFINIFFYRIAEHGTDRSAQILIYLVLIEIFIFMSIKSFDDLQLTKIFLFIGLIISLKAFYVLYLILLIPILFYLKNSFNIKEIFFILLKNLSFYLLSFLFLLVLITNFFNTGCLIYPVNLTCFYSLDWAFSSSEVSQMNDWYEQWSKAGAGPNFRVSEPEKYIQGFNWVGHWINEYFFNKVSDFFLGIISVIIILGLIFYSKKTKKIIINKNILFLFLLLIVLSFEWFYNHPALRYGGYSLISAILFIPASYFFSSFIMDKTKMKKKFFVLIFISLIVFTGRNFIRINNEIVQYKFNPITDFSFRINEGHYRIQKMIDNLVYNYLNCEINNNECNKNLKPKVSKAFNRYMFIKN